MMTVTEGYKGLYIGLGNLCVLCERRNCGGSAEVEGTGAGRGGVFDTDEEDGDAVAFGILDDCLLFLALG